MNEQSRVLMIRPKSFGFNTETAISNVFQNEVDNDSQFIQKKAIEEFDSFVKKLREKGVYVVVINDTEDPFTPDAIFPNNWITFHQDGTVFLYPMFAVNRQKERRPEILYTLKKSFFISDIIDFSEYEKESKFLEGTGSVVFDYNDKIAYACLSPRTNKELFLKLCQKLGYKPISFSSYDFSGQEIYHTNVMMSVNKYFAIICLETILNVEERKMVLSSLKNTGKDIVIITYKQMENFLGNVLFLHTKNNTNVLILSQRAYSVLMPNQKDIITQYCEIIPIDIDIIEYVGGGSVRCMMAELLLPYKPGV